jgi:ABC-type antimicrobial peptide transport system permease subunit
LAVLSVLFLTVYTYGKCKEEAEVYKMLRAIGLPVFDIRLMIYLEILVRMVISIANGIILGLVFSMGLSGQVEEILMLKAPLPALDIVFGIAVALLVIFSATVIKSTQYLTQRTVL